MKAVPHATPTVNTQLWLEPGVTPFLTPSEEACRILIQKHTNRSEDASLTLKCNKTDKNTFLVIDLWPNVFLL